MMKNDFTDNRIELCGSLRSCHTMTFWSMFSERLKLNFEEAGVRTFVHVQNFSSRSAFSADSRRMFTSVHTTLFWRYPSDHRRLPTFP